MRSSMDRKTTIACIITLLLSMFTLPALADIYQFTDDQGVIHFSNVSVGNSKKYKKIKSSPAIVQYTVPSSLSAAATERSLTSFNMPSAYLEMIHNACDRHGVDPALVHAIVKVESDFNPYALSRKGAMGLMQSMPQTAMNMNVRNTFNPNENIDGGVKYLRYLIDRYEGNLSLALAAYNSGESAVKKWGTIPPFPETQTYVQKILKIYNSNGKGFTPHYTIYMGYDEDGALLLTDDPSKHQGKNFKHKSSRDL